MLWYCNIASVLFYGVTVAPIDEATFAVLMAFHNFLDFAWQKYYHAESEFRSSHADLLPVVDMMSLHSVLIELCNRQLIFWNLVLSLLIACSVLYDTTERERENLFAKKQQHSHHVLQ